jgi:hypothetical protein
MATNGNNIKQKLADYFECTECDYVSCRRSNYEIHMLSRKHILATHGNKNKQIISLRCEFCNKDYKDRTGLWRHKKKCVELFTKNTTNIYNIDNNICKDENNILDKSFDKDVILMLIKQNSELVKENSEFKNMMLDQQTMMMEVIKNGTHNTTNNTTNSHNKAFNLNFFLNETCKDAMNIMDFVDSIQLQLSDLENVGKLGYVEGITNIITRNLQALDVTQRPIHCTDKKREIMYIKDENKWEKEDDDKKKIRKAIKRVASKNHRLILKFKEAHPDCLKASSNYSDQYNKIIIESCGGSGDNDIEKEDKIIRNISKTVIVDK